MQKVVQILEKYVEWIVLGLGSAFLLWMVYAYVLQKPVVSTVGTVKVTPGDIDPKIMSGPASALQHAMANQDVPPQLSAPQDFVADLKKRLDANAPLLTMSTPWSGIPEPADFEQPPSQQKQNVRIQVVQLPVVPPPDDLKIEQGRSNVMIPPPQPAPNLANPNSQPPAPTGVGAPADRNWVSISAMIRTKPLVQALADSKIPAALSMVTILKVDLIRQELAGDGTWGDEKTIDPLPTVSLPPFPAMNAGLAAQLPYIQFAETTASQKMLLQPPFYQVLQADPWVVPGLPPPVVAVAEQPFDPSTVTDPSTLTDDQRKLYDAYEAQQKQAKIDAAKARAQQQQQQRGPRGGIPGLPGAAGGERVVNDPDRPMTLAQAVAPRSAYPPPYPPYPPGGTPPMGDRPADGGAGNPAVPADPRTAPDATLPQGAFNAASQPDIVIWAHDDTVAPGKTYRYKLRYYIKNPVFQTFNVCAPQSMADQFAIESKDGDWTDQISVKSETNFFAISTSPSRNSVPVKFDIFRWKSGAWQKQTTEAGPGDMVGTIDPTTQTNFTTGLTLVDVHPDPRNNDDRIITLTNDSGQITRKDLIADQKSAEYKKLLDQMKAALKPAPGTPDSTGTPAAPGTPAPAPRPGGVPSVAG